jgi:hypothetical protein
VPTITSTICAGKIVNLIHCLIEIMTYCVRCELYIKCKRRDEQDFVPFYCDNRRSRCEQDMIYSL